MNVLLSRSTFLRLLGGTAALVFANSFARSAGNDVTNEMIFGDPDAPIGGNPEGDLIIVDFFDYNCPFCKDSAVHLERLVQKDG
jgi:protein-disulfide isomerase